MERGARSASSSRAPHRRRARLPQIQSQKTALYDGPDSWFKTYMLLVQNPAHDKVRDIVDNFDVLIGWLQAFYVLTPIRDQFARSCFVSRLEASRYTVDTTRLESALTGESGYLYACNCQTFVHYSLCKHCVARAMMDGVVTAGPPQFSPDLREPEKQQRGRKKKARRGGALDRHG